MDRFRRLPNYRYYDNTDGIITTEYEMPLRDYKIFGSSDGVGDYDEASGKYKIPVEVNGKNLFDINNFMTGYYSESQLNYPLRVSSDGAIISADWYARDSGTSIVIPAKAGETYSFSWENVSDVIVANCLAFANMSESGYLDGRKIIKEIFDSPTSITVTQPEGYNYIRFGFASPTNTYRYVAKIKNLQIEKSEAPTPYEPYREPEVYNIFIDKPLYEGESVWYKNNSDNLPQIKLKKGTNTIVEKTKAIPDEVNYQYYA